MHACSYHEDRPAVGVCMRLPPGHLLGLLHALDGVNHCHRCLKELGRRAEEPWPSSRAGFAMPMAVLMTGSFFLFLECVFLLEGRLAP